MASTHNFVQYVCEQISSAGEIEYKRMFGEFGLYCDEKFFGLVCNNQFYIKKTEGGGRILDDITEEPPYTGAKPHYLIDFLEEVDIVSKLVCATCAELPLKRSSRTI